MQQLTAAIMGCRHWSHLQTLWHDNHKDLNPIHLCATAVKLSRLVAARGVEPCDRPELFKFADAVQVSQLQLWLGSTLVPVKCTVCSCSVWDIGNVE